MDPKLWEALLRATPAAEKLSEPQVLERVESPASETED